MFQVLEVDSAIFGECLVFWRPGILEVDSAIFVECLVFWMPGSVIWSSGASMFANVWGFGGEGSKAMVSDGERR